MKIGDLVRYRHGAARRLAESRRATWPPEPHNDVGLIISQGRSRTDEFHVQWVKKISLWEREKNLELVYE